MVSLARASNFAAASLCLLIAVALVPGCSRNRSSGGGGEDEPVVPVLGIAPDSVAMTTGKSRDFQVYLAGEPYDGHVVWSAEGGDLVPIPGEGRARYTGRGVPGVYSVNATLLQYNVAFTASVFLSSHEFATEIPFHIPGGEASTPTARASLNGNWAAFGESSAGTGVRIRLVDLVTGQVRSSPALESLYGPVLGVEIVGGDPVALFAPPPGTNFHSLVRFDATLVPAEVIAEFPSAVPPSLARDRDDALLLARSPSGPGGVGSGTEIVRITLPAAGPPVEETLFSLGGPEIRDIAADASDLIYIATSSTVRRYELDGTALDPGTPFRSALKGIFTDIALDAEGAVYVAGTDEIGLDILGETGHEVHAVREYSTPYGFVRGDANGDGVVDLLDLDAFYQFLIGGTVPCRKALDANGDRQITIRDYIFLNEHISFGNTPPPPPYPECGADPDEGSPISCDVGTCEGLRDFTEILALAADPFGDPTSSSRFIAVDDWVHESSAAIAIVFDPIPGNPPAPGDAPTGLRYPVVEALELGEPAFPIHPIAVGGTPELFTISPPLPPGLSIDPVTGVIAGTPLVVDPPTSYTVTAENAAGSVSTDVEIGIGN